MNYCQYSVVIFCILIAVCWTQLIQAQKISEKDIQDSIKSLPTDRQKVDAYLYYVQESGFENFALSKELAEKALALAQKSNYKAGQIKANVAFALIYIYTQPVEAFISLTQAKELAKESKNYELLVYVLEQEAHYHIRWLQYEQASKCIGEAISLISQKRLKREFPYETMASILAKQGKPQEAIVYYQKVIVQKQNIKELPAVLSELGNVYYNIQQYDSARAYYFRGLEIAQKHQMKRDLGYLFDNIGLSLYKQKQYKEAVVWQKKGLAHRKAVHSNLDIIANLNNLGKTYLELKQYDSAYVCAKESYVMCLQFKDIEFLREVTEVLANAHFGLGNLDSAFIYQKEAYQYLDTIRKQQQQQAVKGAALQIEASKQVFENELLKAENRQLFWIGAFLNLLLLCIIIISIVIYRQSKHRKQLLKQLQEAHKTKDRLFAIIGHDLRAPIGSLRGLLNLVNTHTISPEEFLSFSTVLKNNVEHIYFTLNNLLQWANTQMSGIYVKPEAINLYTMAQENCGLLQGFAEEKQISIHNEINKDVNVWADYEQINLVFRNLITNAIKFTPTGGKVTLSDSIEKTVCRITVCDTGIGINQKTLATLFQEHHYISTFGTKGEKGTGLGLILCKDFIEKNGGSIRAESIEGKGSFFSFTLPILNKPD